MQSRYAQTPDVRIMRMVGEQMPRVFRGETTILEHLRPNSLLDDYYVGALGFPKFSKWLGRTVKQIAHRYPHMNVLEIGQSPPFSYHSDTPTPSLPALLTSLWVITRCWYRRRNQEYSEDGRK